LGTLETLKTLETVGTLGILETLEITLGTITESELPLHHLPHRCGAIHQHRLIITTEVEASQLRLSFKSQHIHELSVTMIVNYLV
jgi:hypothetical protein